MMHGQVILIMEHDLFSINVFVKCVGLILNQTKDKVVNPLMLTAAKSSLPILMKSCRQKLSWGNI